MDQTLKLNAKTLLAAAAAMLGLVPASATESGNGPLLAPVPKPRYRGPTPSRRPRKPHPAQYADHVRAPMAKHFRNYAVRYMTKPAIVAAREDLARESRVAQRSGQPERAQALANRAGTYPW